jgi:hypothetical protein
MRTGAKNQLTTRTNEFTTEKRIYSGQRLAYL